MKFDILINIGNWIQIGFLILIILKESKLLAFQYIDSFIVYLQNAFFFFFKERLNF